MTRITKTFDALGVNDQKALITFLTAGYPDTDYSLKAMHALVDAGADIIELGFPFSDPMADGPMIQEASFHAIGNGMNLTKTLDLVKEFRQTNEQTPIILMGYFNPILSYGVEAFAKDARLAGVDGVIIVDLPSVEAGELAPFLKENDIDWIQLITPTTDENRFKEIEALASGFLYYVSIAGVTGTKSAMIDEVKKNVSTYQSATKTPICVGFGIRDSDGARAMSEISKGVIVGTALLETIKKNKMHASMSDQESLTKLTDFVKSLRQAIDA